MTRLILLKISLIFGLTPTLSLAENNLVTYTAEEYSCTTDYGENSQELRLELERVKDVPFMTYNLATCLIIKGLVTNNESLKYIGLSSLKDMNYAPAMFFLAQYFESNLPNNLTEDSIDESIGAYKKTLTQIDLIDLGYGNYYEGKTEPQREIRSYESISYLYSYKTHIGIIGSHNRYLNDSPTLTNNMDSHNRHHPEPPSSYSDFRVIINGLRNIISSSEDCLNLQYDEQNHQHELYNSIQKRCTIFKDIAEILLPLERKRQAILLTDESCAKDVLQCDEYMNIYNEMESVFQTMLQELNNRSRAKALFVFVVF